MNTWLLDGVPTEWTGGPYRSPFVLSYEIGDRAYEAMRKQHETYLDARYPMSPWSRLRRWMWRRRP